MKDQKVELTHLYNPGLAHMHILWRVDAAPPTHPLQVERPTWEWSYGSAFSSSPPQHLWGAWDSLAYTTSLISTCQAASCCGWIQGMSGATSRSHLNWRDESERPGAGTWCWLVVEFIGVLQTQHNQISPRHPVRSSCHTFIPKIHCGLWNRTEIRLFKLCPRR